MFSPNILPDYHMFLCTKMAKACCQSPLIYIWKANISNYRPVSLNSVVCKIAKSLIRDHIMIHFISNNLFTVKQYGFLNGRSTVLQLLHVLDTWVKHLDEGGQIDIIYTDFAKAFDKVPHCRLISKLRSYGVNDQLILWIKVLLHRSQRVKIN